VTSREPLNRLVCQKFSITFADKQTRTHTGNKGRLKLANLPIYCFTRSTKCHKDSWLCWHQQPQRRQHITSSYAFSVGPTTTVCLDLWSRHEKDLNKLHLLAMNMLSPPAAATNASPFSAVVGWSWNRIILKWLKTVVIFRVLLKYNKNYLWPRVLNELSTLIQWHYSLLCSNYFNLTFNILFHCLAKCLNVVMRPALLLCRRIWTCIWQAKACRSLWYLKTWTWTFITW